MGDRENQANSCSNHSHRYSIRAAVMLVMSASQESCGARKPNSVLLEHQSIKKYIHNERLEAEHEFLRVEIPFENHQVNAPIFNFEGWISGRVQNSEAQLEHLDFQRLFGVRKSAVRICPNDKLGTTKSLFGYVWILNHEIKVWETSLQVLQTSSILQKIQLWQTHLKETTQIHSNSAFIHATNWCLFSKSNLFNP